MFELDSRLNNDCHFICDLPLSRALLLNNDQVPWIILVPRIDNIKESIDLSSEHQLQLHHESAFVSNLLRELFSPDKLNVAAIGNLVPQLHVHHIARFKTDPCWPAPVWGNIQPSAYNDKALESLLLQLRSKLSRFTLSAN